jgi:hypothetical protein
VTVATRALSVATCACGSRVQLVAKRTATAASGTIRAVAYEAVRGRICCRWEVGRTMESSRGRARRDVTTNTLAGKRR